MKNSLNFFVFILIVTTIPTAGADGIMSVMGQLVSCDDTSCKIKIDHLQIYKVNLKKLTQMQARELKFKKSGEFVSTSLPMSAVVSVDDVKKK